MPPGPRAEGAEHTSPGQSREAGAALGSWREILGRPARAAANGSSSGRCHSRWRQRITLPRMARGVWAAPLQGAGALEDINPGRRATALALGWPAARRWRAKCPNSSGRQDACPTTDAHGRGAAHGLVPSVLAPSRPFNNWWKHCAKDAGWGGRATASCGPAAGAGNWLSRLRPAGELPINRRCCS